MKAKKETPDKLVDLNEGATVTGYAVGTIRNLVYKGKLTNHSKRSTQTKGDGVRKRGQKIRLSLKELIEVLGAKESA